MSVGNSFTKAALIEYPRKGLWAIVFISTETKGEVAERLRKKASTVSVFLPTTPNPTSGFLLFVPKEDIVELSMGVEDAAKLVILGRSGEPGSPRHPRGCPSAEPGEAGGVSANARMPDQPARKSLIAASRPKR